MYKFRPQRGSLYEAMSEVKVFQTLDELKAHVANLFNEIIPGAAVPRDVSIGKESINDMRIDWKNTHMVLINKLNNVDYIQKYGCGQCVGFVDII